MNCSVDTLFQMFDSTATDFTHTGENVILESTQGIQRYIDAIDR